MLEYIRYVLLCICVHFIIFTFSKQAFHESLDFSTFHSLMNDKNLIESCQANLPVQYASSIECIRQN